MKTRIPNADLPHADHDFLALLTDEVIDELLVRAARLCACCGISRRRVPARAYEPHTLLNEALLRILNGRRLRPSGMSVVLFLSRVMKCILYDEFRLDWNQVITCSPQELIARAGSDEGARVRQTISRDMLDDLIVLIELKGDENALRYVRCLGLGNDERSIIAVQLGWPVGMVDDVRRRVRKYLWTVRCRGSRFRVRRQQWS